MLNLYPPWQAKLSKKKKEATFFGEEAAPFPDQWLKSVNSHGVLPKDGALGLLPRY
jgi:hypothetical protein